MSCFQMISQSPAASRYSSCSSISSALLYGTVLPVIL